MPWSPDEMAQMVAADVADGWVVNVGIGQPTSILPHLQHRDVLVHSENGILGIGPAPPPGREDPDVIDAGKNFATILPGGVVVDASISFALVRGGCLDAAVLGAYQVSGNGDLANWRVPGRRVGGIGGAADIAHGAKRVWVMMTHATTEGEPKIVRECTYPLTARGVVKRIYTELAVLDVTRDGLSLRTLAPDVTLSALQAATGVPVLTT
jgi:3-oxoadipate CoA-transferase, beta subunit